MANGSNSSIKIQLQITNLAQVRQQIQSLGGAVNLGGGGSSGGNSGSGGGGFSFSPSVNSVIGFDANIKALQEFKGALFAIINPLKEASEAAFKFEASIVATVGTLQATTRILDARGIQVDPGTQLREQFRIATGLEKAGRSSLAPIGVGGAEQSLLTNTFIQAQTTKTGVAVSEQDLKTTLPRLVAAIKVLAPNLGETREAKELRDIVLNQRVGQITAGPGIRALAPDLAKARTAQEFEEATRPLEAYITALKEGNTPLAERLKLEGEFHILQQDVGEAFNQALLPGFKSLEDVISNPAFSEALQNIADKLGTLASNIIEAGAKLSKDTVDNSRNTNNLLTENKDNPIVRGIFDNSFIGNLLLPGAGQAIGNSDADDIKLQQLQFENAQRRAGKINFNKLKGNEAGPKLTADSSPESKFATLLSGLALDPEKFNKTTSSDLSNLSSDPNVQIFQGRELFKGIPGAGLDAESANERSLGALRLIAGGQEKVRANTDRTFASNIPGQVAKSKFDIGSFKDQISTQREIVANRREAIAGETDPLKKGLLEGELQTELLKLKEDLKGFGDALKEAEAQPLKVAKAFSDLTISTQQLNNLGIRQAIARGAAADAVSSAKRDRENFIAEGPLRQIQRQSAVISAAGKFGEAGGTNASIGAGGFAGAAAQEAATRGLLSFKDALESAKKAVDDFKDGFDERKEDRQSAVFNAQKALESAQNAPSGDTGEEQDQRQRNINSAQRAVDKARERDRNGIFDDTKEEDKLKSATPSFFERFLKKDGASADLDKANRTLAQGGDVDAEGLRGKNRALAIAGLDKAELTLKQTNELLSLLNARLAQLQNLGLTPASKPGAEDSGDGSGADSSGSGGNILEEQKKLNKLYGPKGKGAINGPPSPAATLSGHQEKASIAAGLFDGLTGTEFHGTDGKTTGKGASIAAELIQAVSDSSTKDLKKNAKKLKGGFSDEDVLFGESKSSLFGKPLSKSDTEDAFYNSLNRHFN